MSFTEGCIWCGKELVYAEADERLTCIFCGKISESNVQCPDGHFVCDKCHSASAVDVIEKYCNQTTLTDPGRIARHLMHHPRMHMHGPEHHFLVPAALLAAWYNHQGETDHKPLKIHIARKRAEAVLGGFCGSHGNCGAGVGAGIFISLITGNSPLAEKEWQLSNRMTAEALIAISDSGGPRCCKRDSYISIGRAVKYLEDHFDVSLPLETINCSFSDRNRQCKLVDCAFYPD